MVKAVFGRAGPGFEIAQDKGLAKSGVVPGGLDYAAVASVGVTLEVFVAGGAAKATASLTLYGADDLPLPGYAALPMGEIALSGPLAAKVLAGEPLGAGVIQTSTQSGKAFDVSYDSLTVTALGQAAEVAEVTIAAGPTVVEAGDEGATALLFDLATTGADGTLSVAYTLDGVAAQAEVTFAGGAGTLTIEVPNDDLATVGAARTVILTGVGEGAVLGAAVSATGTVTEDDFAPAPDQGVPAQVAAQGAAFALVIPADAFADADSALSYTATLADGSALPTWLAFDGTAFSGTPEAGDAGTVSVLVTASDGSNPTATTTFDLTVGEPGNTAPTNAAIDAGSTLETDEPVVIALLANAVDADGDALAVIDVTVTDGAGFDVPFTLDGSTLTIDPAALANFVEEGESETVTVAYTITDGRGGAVPGSATLVVEGVDGSLVWYLDADGDGFGTRRRAHAHRDRAARRLRRPGWRPGRLQRLRLSRRAGDQRRARQRR